MSRRRYWRDARGLSLIELIAALAVLSLLVLVLGESLSGGVAGAARVERMAAETDRIAGAYRLTRDLLERARAPSRAGGGAPSPDIFTGTADRIDFAAIMPEWPGDAGRAHLRLAFEGSALTLHLRPLASGAASASAAGAWPVLLLDGIGAARFSYRGRDDDPAAPWRADWRDPAELPWLIRLRLSSRDGAPLPDLIVRPMVVARPR